VPFIIYCGKALQSRPGTDEYLAQPHCVLDTWSYKRTLRICNTYCFSTATMATPRPLNITLYVHCLSCSFCHW